MNDRDLISRKDVIELLTKWADGYWFIETPLNNAITDVMDLRPAEYSPLMQYRDCSYCPLVHGPNITRLPKDTKITCTT